MAAKKAAPNRRAKSTGGLYQRASDQMWCASVELPAPPGERRRKVIVRAKKADALRELREARKAFERTGDLRTSSTTVAQWCDIWWERYGMTRLKVSTRSTYRSKIENYIKPSIGKVPLDRLSLDHVYRMHAYVTETVGIDPASALAAHRVLSVIVSDAEREDRVGRNVVKLADKPRVGKKPKAYLDNAQARHLLVSSAQRDPAEAARWATALLTGMRQGERLALSVDMLDFGKDSLTKAWQLRRIPFDHGCGTRKPDGTWPCGRKRGGNCLSRQLPVPPDQEVINIEGGLYLTRPKSRASWHTIPMVDLLHDILERHLAEHPPTNEHGLIFTRPDGRPIDPADDASDWDAALRVAGLPDVDGHSARHTCNTVLTELGVPVDVRKQILGHASRAVNETVYTHTSDVRVAEAMRQLSAAMDYRDLSAPPAAV